MSKIKDYLSNIKKSFLLQKQCIITFYDPCTFLFTLTFYSMLLLLSLTIFIPLYSYDLPDKKFYFYFYGVKLNVFTYIPFLFIYNFFTSDLFVIETYFMIYFLSFKFNFLLIIFDLFLNKCYFSIAYEMKDDLKYNDYSLICSILIDRFKSHLIFFIILFII
ncbi:hypothetical protein H311_04885, partial [Anncaliia algerae PRA109]